MQAFNLKIFDETISGSGTTWHTTGDLDTVLGQADLLGIMAYAMDVEGSGTVTLKVDIQTSADGEHWVSVDALEENIEDNTAYKEGTTNVVLAQFARLEISFTSGTSPKCRLKITATGRAL